MKWYFRLLLLCFLNFLFSTLCPVHLHLNHVFPSFFSLSLPLTFSCPTTVLLSFLRLSIFQPCLFLSSLPFSFFFLPFLLLPIQPHFQPPPKQIHLSSPSFLSFCFYQPQFGTAAAVSLRLMKIAFQVRFFYVSFPFNLHHTKTSFLSLQQLFSTPNCKCIIPSFGDVF